MGGWEYPEIVTNGDMGGGGSKNCHFCGDVHIERPLICFFFNTRVMREICSKSTIKTPE